MISVKRENTINVRKPFDLEERTYQCAKDVISLSNACPRTVVNVELIKQLVRSAGSVGANYIEAREALSKKDFALRIKICRKEVKESLYWLKLIEVKDGEDGNKRDAMVSESTELLKIFASIVEKLKERKTS
jgi:four helix bundle protein